VARFYGVGCPHPVVECLTAQLKKVIMHYGSQSCLGLNMQASLELLVIEMGTSLQPSFKKDYYLPALGHTLVAEIGLGEGI
jgi:hypothetical protein